MILTAALILASLLVSPVHAADMDTVHIAVGINICGNGLVESPAEDCEGTNLAGNTCSTLGYRSGTLRCDLACTYDTSSCIPQSTTTPAASSYPLSTTLLTPTPSPTPTPNPILVAIIAAFDTNGDGKIVTQELVPVLTRWVQIWKNSTPTSPSACDLNHDRVCDLRDLSVLLYYVHP